MRRVYLLCVVIMSFIFGVAQNTTIKRNTTKPTQKTEQKAKTQNSGRTKESVAKNANRSKKKVVNPDTEITNIIATFTKDIKILSDGSHQYPGYNIFLNNKSLRKANINNSDRNDPYSHSWVGELTFGGEYITTDIYGDSPKWYITLSGPRSMAFMMDINCEMLWLGQDSANELFSKIASSLGFKKVYYKKGGLGGMAIKYEKGFLWMLCIATGGNAGLTPEIYVGTLDDDRSDEIRDSKL